MINEIIGTLESIRETRLATEQQLAEIISREEEAQRRAMKLYTELGEYLKVQAPAEEMPTTIQPLYTFKSSPMEACEQESPITEEVESDKKASADMEKASTVFYRSATECPNVTMRNGILHHRGMELTKVVTTKALKEMYSSEDFNEAFSWTHIKLIKINGLYTSGNDLTNIIKSILGVILKNKPLDRLKILRQGAKILNKTIAAMEASGVNYIRENPDIVTVKGSNGNKIKGLIYILRCTNHIDMIDGIEFYTTEQ